MKLIVESDIKKIDIIKEEFSKDKPNTIKLKGPFLEYGLKNGNNRTYLKEELEEQVKKFDEEMIKTGRALCELEHPDTIVISPENACARILSLTQNDADNQFIGEAVVLASDDRFGIKGTPKGDVLASLLQYGTAVGFSSRGVGEVIDNVVHDYQLVTVDCVLQPSIGKYSESNAGRFVNGILESKEFVLNHHGFLVEKAYNKVEKDIEKSSHTYINSKKNEIAAEAVYNFFKNLKV
jgi:hypothetical protein